MSKLNKRKRIIVITRADKSVLYCIGKLCEHKLIHTILNFIYLNFFPKKGNRLNEIAVPKIDSDKIIDTSSAGDAFVGKTNILKDFFLF